MRPKRCPLPGLVVVLALAACGTPTGSDPSMVAEWIHTLYGTVRAERLSPPVASRLLGYAAVALHEGLAAVTPGMTSLGGRLNGLASLPAVADRDEYDATLVAVAAEATVLDSLLAQGLPTVRAQVAGLADSLRTARAAAGVSVARQRRSADLGHSIGLAVVAWARVDGFAASRGRAYDPPVGPARWVNDAPASIYSAQQLSAATQSVTIDNPSNALRPGTVSDRNLVLNRPKRPGTAELPAVNPAGATEPYWGENRPFVLERWDACPVPEPPEYGIEPGAPLYQEARAVADTAAALTDEQRAIALYWADNAGETGTPTGHWVAIAGQLLSERGLSAPEAARLFALTAVAQADAFIAAWGYKYRDNLIRPRTFIRRVIDPSWEPLIPTPPFPEHPAGHSTQSAAAATVMTALLGAIPFDDSTGVAIGNPVRRFASFAAAADEAGRSRIYGGIHFPSGDAAGRRLGRCIGDRVVERLVRTP